MTNIEKEIEKARRKPLAGEKLKELLLKLRKNATGTLTFGKLVNVVDAINWGIAGVLGWVPIHYEAHGDKKAMPVLVPVGRFSNEVQFESARQNLVDASVDSLPDSPNQAGERAIMNVSNVLGKEPHYRHFTHDEWRGAEGVIVETDGGEVSEPILPGRYDVENRMPSALPPNRLVHDIWKWMMQNGVEEAIAEALGMGVHVPAAERTRENTGTCPACWGNYKLDGGRLVMHGYKRPGFGYIHGSCFGVSYQPAETSKEGLVDVLERLLTPDLEECQDTIDNIEAGKVTQLEGRRGEIVKVGEPSFDHLLEQLLRHLEQKVKYLEREIGLYQTAISAWKQRPLPQEGQAQRTMKFFLS